MKPLASNDLIAPVEAAELLSVDPKTVGRWASAGKINAVRTPGGHRRFLRSEILAIRAADGGQPMPPADRVSDSSAADRDEHDNQRRDVSESARWAAFSIAEAVMLAARSEADEAAADVVRTAEAVATAAHTAVEAASRAREARLQAAEEVAEAVAMQAARTAAEVKLRLDATARKLCQSASDAAALVLVAYQEGDEREETTRALQLASAAVEAAVAAAEESAIVAAEVARAVAAAAAAVAAQVAADDAAIENEVATVAAAVQFTATAQAREKAADTEARARAKAVVAREAARAVRRRAIDREHPASTVTLPAPTPGYATVQHSGSR